MDRNRFLMIAVIVVAVIFIFNPFGRRRSAERLYPDSAPRETLEPLASFLEAHGQAPEAYVAGLFADHDIVFLGEFPKVRQQVEFVRTLIPALHEAGVDNLGIEHALHEDQARLDALVTAPEFDEGLAEEIYFHFVALWGFEEYVDVLRGAWELNRSLPEGSRPFRVVGLNVRRNWRAIKNDSDLENPEVIAQVFEYGVPDVYMADVIQREFTDRGEKALIYCNLQTASTRYRNKEYAQNAREKGLSETRRAGNIVYDRIGRRAAFVPIHAPWPDRSTLSRVNYPVGGLLDRLQPMMPDSERRIGFDVTGTPFAGIPIKSDVYLSGYEELTLGDYADGYVMLGPLRDYEPVTPIPGFINEENLQEAVDNFPGPLPIGNRPTVAQLNQYIAQDLDSLERILRQFQ